MEGILRAVDAVFPEQSPTTRPADASVQSGERSDTCSALARHTELPWEFRPQPGADMHMICNKTTIVACIPNTEQFWPEDKDTNYANAAYLVKCANAYPAHIELLRQTRGLLNLVKAAGLIDDAPIEKITAALVEAGEL